ncbi:MAG TPA: BON domain-containing protein [Verrucomicrobiae bacterium]|nr:BON domain-containing protein [Verrucomicrobiae bacterium]
MKAFKLSAALFTLFLLMSGCSNTPKSPDVSASVRKSLDQAGLKDVSVSDDRDKGVVTLNGHVPSDADKQNAESIAKSAAGSQVVANQIEVTPKAAESEAKTINSDLDKGISKNLDAALVQHNLKKGVSCEVKNGVVTLSGTVSSESRRTEVANIASKVPNVSQVVNELQIKGQKATSSQ